jgi:hypothetical protein
MSCHRTESACISNEPTTYTEYDSKTGAVMGTASLAISQDAELSATSTTWDEAIYVSITAVSGAVSTLEIGFTASCTSPCSMVQPSPWVGLQPIGQGQTLSGHVTYTDTPNPGPDSINPSYQLEVIQPGATPTQPYLNWSSVTTWRCDNLVTSYAGCAIPAYTPTLGISFSQRGAAAATYDWAQINLPDHWGSSSKNQPLHRLADSARQQTNRDIICDGTFVKDPAVVNDSCDEFSFAATYESGAMFGLTGSQCAEIEPYQQNGLWYFKDINTVTGTERCVRSHVPLADNTGAGSDVAALTNTYRMLDHDPYWLAFVS